MDRPHSLLLLDRVDRFAGFTPLALRVFIGVFLVFMSQDNVFSAARMREFVAFLETHHFPMPAPAAHVSVYAQLTCGVLLLVGALTRWAALVMIINFTVAIVGVHRLLPFRTFVEPSAMLAVSIALFLGGPGRLSVDDLLRRRRAPGA